jgi:hypothetical protein
MLINPYNYIESEIPKLHPLSYEYVEYWREQKRRCIEGYWVGGKWMPGNLYFYLNFGTILLNKSKNSKVKTPGRPKPYDFLWDFAYKWAECRGLSGFADQKELILLNELRDNNFPSDEEVVQILKLEKELNIRNTLADSTVSLGKPLYTNEAKNMVWMANRGPGKSYGAANIVIAHEFLFDGLTEYTDESIKNPPAVEILVGAEDAKYSGDLLKKTKLTLDNLEGGFMVGETYYPSPFFKQYTGQWQASKEIIHKYKKKVGGKWKEIGTGASIKHRSYNDNPFAAQGTRPSVAVKEEIGMFKNLIATHEADEETQKNGSIKFGSTLYMGTGGDMMGGGTLDAMKMFYDPKTYNCIELPDDYENKGSIGFFTNAVFGKTDYKDKYGITNVDYALNKENEVRDQKRKGTIEAYEAYIQYNPLVPSEMFLAKANNIFPVIEAQNTLIALNQDSKFTEYEKVVELYFDPKTPTGVNYRLDLTGSLKPITEFPLKDTNNIEGAVIIYEFPQEINGVIPNDLYIIGHDPVAQDQDGPSLNSVYVLKNKKYFNLVGHDEIVAEYIGRPSEGRHVVNDIIEKLWMFYGSPPRGVYFENMVGNTKEYFEKRKKLSALCHQPKRILSKRDNYNSSSVVVYGYPMNNKHFKRESEQYTRDWLIEPRGKDDKDINVLNVHNIKSRFLLQQLIHYSSDGNFDAVMGFMGCIIGLNETHNQYLETIEDKKHPLDFLLNNKNLFKTNV